ncbi:MAG: T9SS type A sorting domain-containing protein [Bacteroidota bacterium]
MARFKALVKKLAPVLGRHGLQRALGSMAGLLGLTLSVHAQFPVLSEVVINPFGLDSTSIATIHVPILVDIDDDGDLDLFHTLYNGPEIYGSAIPALNFFENIGTASEPQFAAPVMNPFGFNAGNNDAYTNANFADFDQDGDIDILAQQFYYIDEYTYSEFLAYYENTGTASSPQFADPVEDPFDLPEVTTDETYGSIFISGDMDTDGDIDLLLYQAAYGNLGVEERRVGFIENSSVSGDPDFQEVQPDPFGLDDLSQLDPEEYNVPVQLVDLDNDGDLDILGTTSRYDYDTYEDEYPLFFIENTGNQENASYGNLIYVDLNISSDQLNNFIIPVAGDLDNDGDLDILGVSYDFGFVYFENLLVSSVREQTVELDLELFPNPAADIIQLRTRENLSDYILLDNNGRELKRVSGRSTEISIEDLPAGQYWLKAVTKENTFGLFSVMKN